MSIRVRGKLFSTSVLSALTVLGVGLGLAPEAQAGPRSYASVRQQSLGPTAHGDIIIGATGTTKSIVLPFGKSTTVQIPGDLRDVVVSNPDVIDASVHTSNRVVLSANKKVGQTNVYFYGANGEELLDLEIRIERDLKDLRALIRKYAPDANVEVKAISNNILLTGDVPNASTAENIVKMADMWRNELAPGSVQLDGKVYNLMNITGNQQVMLKVRIVEVQRSVTKQMGIDFNALTQIGDASLGIVSNAAVGATTGLSGNVGYTSQTGTLRSLTSNLKALEKVGLVRTLAEPNLTTVSGETANFLAGGEFPLLTNVFVDQNGQLQREFEYKKFGVSLGFTPVVLSRGRISINLSTEVSEPTTDGAFKTANGDVLAIRTRRANTVVELPAGGSMVIAGLIRQESRQATEGTPGLKDVPGIGALFRNRDDSNTDTELVIIVTPYLVNPTHPDKLQTPLDGMVVANDREAILLGRLNKVYGKNAKIDPKKHLYGPFGHVVD